MTDFSATTQCVARPPLIVRISLFVTFAILDVGFNAAAGAAAASTGAHVNSNSNSRTAQNAYNLSHILGVGALAGLLKSSILALVGFGQQFGGMGLGMWLIMALVASTFGICVVVTSAVCSLTLGEVPGGLLIAAIVTAIPLGGEMVGVQISPDNHAMAFSLMGWDALAGYVFARMAHNEGFDICSYNAGAAAGAVYGALTCTKSLVVSCIKGPTTKSISTDHNGTVTTLSNWYGSYTYHDPHGRPDPFDTF